jgi:hypothetical protein
VVSRQEDAKLVVQVRRWDGWDSLGVQMLAAHRETALLGRIERAEPLVGGYLLARLRIRLKLVKYLASN